VLQAVLWVVARSPGEHERPVHELLLGKLVHRLSPRDTELSRRKS
jgi:hypothetical protein